MKTLIGILLLCITINVNANNSQKHPYRPPLTTGEKIIVLSGIVLANSAIGVFGHDTTAQKVINRFSLVGCGIGIKVDIDGKRDKKRNKKRIHLL